MFIQISKAAEICTKNLKSCNGMIDFAKYPVLITGIDKNLNGSYEQAWIFFDKKVSTQLEWFELVLYKLLEMGFINKREDYACLFDVNPRFSHDCGDNVLVIRAEQKYICPQIYRRKLG